MNKPKSVSLEQTTIQLSSQATFDGGKVFFFDLNINFLFSKIPFILLYSRAFKEDDKKLVRLLKNGDIDIRENLGVTNTGLIFTRKVWSTFPKSHDDGLHTILHGIVP